MPRFLCACFVSAIAMAAVLFFPATAMRAEGWASSPARPLPGWTSLPKGTRTVFVGIQGGTSPVTLLPSLSGGYVAVHGGTGRDFQRLMGGSVDIPEPSLLGSDTRVVPQGIAFWLRQMLHTQPDIELFAEDTQELAPRHVSPLLPSRFLPLTRFDDDDA